MQRTNRLVLGLIAVFVLGSSLMLLSCGSDDDTTDIDASNAASQFGGRQFPFTAETDFGVAVVTLAFNAYATRFALTLVLVGQSGIVSMVRLVYLHGRGEYVGVGTGPRPGQVFTVDPCQTDQSDNNNLILGDRPRQ